VIARAAATGSASAAGGVGGAGTGTIGAPVAGAGAGDHQVHIVGKGKTNTSTTSKAKAKGKAAVAPGTGGGAGSTAAPASDVSAPHVVGDVGGARGGRQHHQEPPLQRQVGKNEHNNLWFGSAHGPFSQLSSSSASGGAEQLGERRRTQHKHSMTVDLSSVLTQRPPLNQNQLRRASYTFKRKILTDPDFLTEEVAVDRKGVGENAPAEVDGDRHLPAEGHPRTRPTTSSTTGAAEEQKTGSTTGASSSTPPPVVMILAADLDPTRSVVWDGVGRHSSSGAAGGLQTPLRASVTSRFQDEEQEDVLREWESWLVETDSAEAFREEPDLFSYWREAVEEAKLEEAEEEAEEKARAALVESSQSRGRGAGEDSTSEQDERPREEERQLERPLGDDRTTSTTPTNHARTLQRKWAKVFERWWPEEESWLHLFLTPFLPILTAVCPLWARALLAEAVFGEGVRFPTMNWALDTVRERVFGVWAPPAASSGPELVVPGSGLEPIGALAGDQVDGKNSTSSTFHRTSTSCKASSSGVDEYLNVPVFVREDLALFFPQYTNFFLLFSSSPACRTTFSEGETESCVKEEDTAAAVLELGDHGEVLANKTTVTVVGRGGSDVIDVEVGASHNATQTNAGSPAATPGTSLCESVCAPRASGSLADDTQDERNKAPGGAEPEDVGSFGRRRKKSMLRMAAEHLCSCTERMTTEGTTSSCEQTHDETTSTSTTGGVVRGENLVSEQLGEHDEPLEVESADYMMMEIDVATKPRPSGGAAAEVDTQQQERARDVEQHTSRTTSTTSTEHNTSTRSRRRANLMDEKAMPLEEPPEPPAQWVVRPRHQQLEEAPRRFHVTLMEKYRRGQDIGTYNAYDMAPH